MDGFIFTSQQILSLFSRFSEGWREVLTPDTLADLSFVSSHPGPVTPTPLSPRQHQQKDLWDEEGEGRGHLFYDFSLLLGFQAHSFLPRPPESGGHHLYRCLGIKAPWPPLLGGGQGARGRGGLPFVPASRVGFSSHRPPQQNDSDEVMLTRTLTHTVNGLHSHTNMETQV